MKIKIAIVMAIALILASATPIYARPSARRKATRKTVSAGSILTPNRGYGSKNSYDEFHTVPRDIPANDNHNRPGSIDELHINSNYEQDVWHPESRGGRINGFDEFRFSDEM